LLLELDTDVQVLIVEAGPVVSAHPDER